MDAPTTPPIDAEFVGAIPKNPLDSMPTQAPPVEKPKIEPPKQDPETLKRKEAMKKMNPLTVDLQNLTTERQQQLAWMLKAKYVPAAGFNVEKPWAINFGRNNYAIISKGNMTLRCIPFGWFEDIDTKQCWAAFDKNLFIGKAPAGMFAGHRFILLIPFDKSPDMCDYSGQTYLARFDEISERQISLFKKDTEQNAADRQEDKLATSELEQLRALLISQTKQKLNLSGLIKLAVIIIVIAFIGYYVLKNPQILHSLWSIGRSS